MFVDRIKFQPDTQKSAGSVSVLILQKEGNNIEIERPKEFSFIFRWKKFDREVMCDMLSRKSIRKLPIFNSTKLYT